ncbi:MAG: M20/M25/M40 family metallo-hydrolase [Acidimicrobiales bacterium]|jgi:acetylornithine deacetylase/succinyl-diaminopimelate desuccinylase-like protein
MTSTTRTTAPADLLAASEVYWESEALPILAEYVRIPCLSPEFDSDWASHGEIGRAATLLKDWASHRAIEGLSVELVQLPGLTPVIIADVAANRSPSASASASGSAGAGEGLPTLLYGHLDKQPPLGAWRSGLAPFEPVREGDRLYGRGTADDGYSIFAALGSIEIAQRTGKGHGRCVALIEASEESGSPHLEPYLKALPERLGEAGPGLVICLDSGASSYDRLWYTTSLRGGITATIKVAVLRDGIHSGLGGAIVPDSFRILRELMSRIEDEHTGEVLLESCAVEIPALRRTEAEALVAELGAATIDRFPVVPGLRLACDGRPVDQLLARAWHASIAFVGIDGVPPIADAGNVLRPFTAAKIALRIPPSADSAAVSAELERRLTNDPPDGAEVEVVDVSPANGFDAPPTASWLTEASQEASLAYFGAPARGMGEGGTIPFLSALLTAYPEAQFLVTGVLGPDSNAHGVNEMLHIPTAKRLTASVAHVLSRSPQ